MKSRWTILALASVVTVLLAGGLALAVTKSCPGGECLGTNSANDTLTGSANRDVMYGRGGVDQLMGQGGNDEMYGGPGGDRLSGGVGNDEMYGGSGNDTLNGDSGVDRLYGGSGGDTIDSSGDATIDVVDCGDGTDTVTISEAGGPDVTFECENIISEGIG